MSPRLTLTLPSYLSGELVPWRGSGGEARLSIVCRASYRLEPDQVQRLGAVSEPSGVQAPFKSVTDVVVVGHGAGAQGAGGEPGRLEIGEVDKRLAVVDGKLTGTGPLAADSSERRRWLGRHTDWQEAHLADRGFPSDADWRYWNVAPADQQLARPLTADERIVVALPGKLPLTTRLAGDRAAAYAVPRETAGAADADALELLADTLWVDLDRMSCTVSWRGQVDASATGVVFVSLVRGESDFESVRRRARAGASSGVEELTTEDIVTVDPDEALPFQAKPGDAPRPAPTIDPADLRKETGTLGPEELQAAMGSLASSRREAAPWLAPPTNPPSGASPAGTAGAAWAPRGSAPPPRPSAPPPVGAPPPPAPTHPPVAPPRAVLSPSTFAAAAVAQTPATQTAVGEASPSAEASPRATTTPGASTQLSWFDPGSVERVRAYFSELIDELDFVEPDPKRDLASDDPAEAKAHHHCLGVMSRGRCSGSRDLQEAFSEAGSEGAFVAPVVLVEGALRPSFDDVARIERLVALLSPLALGDDKLQAELEQVSKLLDSPFSLRVGGTAQRIARQLEELFAPKNRAAVDGIGDKVERLLLEDRAFARRPVFGAPHVRVALTCRDDDAPMVAYLPEEAAEELPLMSSFPCRLLAEVHPRQDELESHPLALSVVAFGRIVRAELPRWGASARRAR